MLADDRSVSLGKMSFEITDPAGLASLDETALEGVISLTTDEIGIMYLDDDYKYQFTDEIASEWNVTRTLIDVVPAVEESTVTAYGIYGDGTISDLITYLNKKMNTVIQRYSGGEQLLDTVVWDENADSFTIDQSYDPLGGVTYEVTQSYMEKTVTVKVTVTKVTITGFEYDNRIKTYTDDNRPTGWDDLEMPETITPLLDGIDDIYPAGGQAGAERLEPE